MATSALVSKVARSFDLAFEALTGNRPYEWQKNLYHEFLDGRVLIGELPDINLPTGAGKTSIMAIWLIALAQQAQEARSQVLPRRLVWVVDRRVVVDQATEEAKQIRGQLANQSATPELDGVRDGLRKLSCAHGTSELIAISTLRGEKEDNREWSRDPSRPAIIVGTVDMIGSRLLFSGYGDGRYWRAQHAGLLGHDALIVNDEAHLTPAFAKLLCEIEKIQNGGNNAPKPLKPFRTIRLSATHPDAKCWPESLEEDRQHPHFKKVFEAKKKLHILPPQPAAKLDSAIVELATEEGSGRTIIFVTEPEKAQKLAAAIQKKVGDAAANRVLTLTGTMRGFERDQLVEKEEFKVFTKTRMESAPEDYWLVATSAGEVGINITSDRLITTLDTLDHLLQRFGRLNRFGEPEGGAAYLVCSEKEKDKRRTAALEFLRKRLRAHEDVYDISPAAIFGLPLDPDACSEPPLLAPLRPWLIDVWSETTLGRHPSRPEVGPWLRGKQENIPETYVAWREEVRLLEKPDESLIEDDDREEILSKYRLLAHEQLREPTYKFVEKLAKLFAKGNREVIAWRRKIDGTVEKIHLPLIRGEIDLRHDADGAIQELAYCQLILPPGCGKLENGMFQPEWVSPAEAGAEDGPRNKRIAYDVSGTQLRKTGFAVPEERAAYLATPADGKAWLLKRLSGIPNKDYPLEPLAEWNRSELDRFAKDHDWRFLLEIKLEREEASSAPDQHLVYFGPAYEKKAVVKLFIDPHNSKVSEIADLMAGKLNLPAKLMQALKASGLLHDIGKKQPIWQKAAGNWDAVKGGFKESELVAKPIGIMKGRQLGGFRHEFSSLLGATRDSLSRETDPEIWEFMLHLIASHHGHGRPYFESKAYDKTQSLRDQDDLALENVRRFAKLQRKYGAWGLAYFESILRAADALASEASPEQPENA